METVYDAAGGADGLLRLAHAWHARVMADEVVSHAFSHGFHPQHSQRLASYWAESLGGPTTYTDCYGFGLANDDRLGQVLHDYFAWATTTTMSRYHASADDVPDGLPTPRWSWDGLVNG
jgi:hemoglobin